ncbi:hypothetical protein GBAR_LOCUS2660 [Geodia barretti]|uniref:Uncharacterized protein n=1 Tax=Geodia barretti TaxID=519541 RepID=A0AA35VYW1_GEOBA|nr:hypothetical protein GBAR_LOCUS2660 [Geodia barretti]
MNEGCLHHCVEIWVTNLQPSWEKLSHVLKELGEEELARQVLNKGQNDAANDQVVSYQDNTRDGGEMVLKVRQRHITNKKRNEGSNVMTYLGQCARPAAPFPQDVKDLEKNNPDSGMVEPSSQELKGGTTPELWSTDSGGGKEMLAGEGGSDGEGEVAGGEGQTGGIVNGHQEGGVGGGKPSRGSDSKVVTGVEETVFYTYDSEAGSRKGENVVPPDDCSSDVQYDRSTFTVIEESPIISCSDKEESGIIKPCTVVPLMVSSSEEEKYVSMPTQQEFHLEYFMPYSMFCIPYFGSISSNVQRSLSSEHCGRLVHGWQDNTYTRVHVYPQIMQTLVKS